MVSGAVGQVWETKPCFSPSLQKASGSGPLSSTPTGFGEGDLAGRFGLLPEAG